jgi:hypothetical protein
VNAAGRPRFPLGAASQTVSGSNHPILHAGMRYRATDLQRSALLQGRIVGAPVRCAVRRRCEFAHAIRLTSWSQKGESMTICATEPPQNMAP